MFKRRSKELAKAAVDEHELLVEQMRLAKALRDKGFLPGQIEKSFQIVGSQASLRPKHMEMSPALRCSVWMH